MLESISGVGFSRRRGVGRLGGRLRSLRRNAGLAGCLGKTAAAGQVPAWRQPCRRVRNTPRPGRRLLHFALDHAQRPKPKAAPPNSGHRPWRGLTQCCRLRLHRTDSQRWQVDILVLHRLGHRCSAQESRVAYAGLRRVRTVGLCSCRAPRRGVAATPAAPLADRRAAPTARRQFPARGPPLRPAPQPILRDGLARHSIRQGPPASLPVESGCGGRSPVHARCLGSPPSAYGTLRNRAVQSGAWSQTGHPYGRPDIYSDRTRPTPASRANHAGRGRLCTSACRRCRAYRRFAAEPPIGWWPARSLPMHRGARSRPDSRRSLVPA